jgi:3-isopropylmalate/(R)-2-methylmalate dehydratase small subunit
VLNQSRYKDAKVLLAKDNFGCGSSREHAPWALDDYGFRAILAPSYADIFFNNCFKNGLLPIVLDKATISALFTEVEANQGYQLEVDLEQQIIIKPDGSTIEFSVDAFRKNCLLNGLDDIGLTLEESETIRNFEESWRSTAPWYFTTSNATTT